MKAPLQRSIYISGNPSGRLQVAHDIVNEPAAEPVFELLPMSTFDGSSQCIDRVEGSAADLPGTGAYTIQADIKPQSDVALGGIVGWGTYGHHSRVNALRMAGPNRLIHYWWGNDLGASLSTSLADEQFHNVAVSYDGSTRKMYVDYVLVGSDSATGYFATDKSSFCVGQTNNNENFRGGIKNVMIWDYARIPEVASL